MGAISDAVSFPVSYSVLAIKDPYGSPLSVPWEHTHAELLER